MRILRLILITLILFTSLVQPRMVLAQDANDPRYQEKLREIEDLKKKLADVQQQSQTLSSAIAYLNLKQALIQRQIDATQFQIQLLQRDIESLGGKITLLEGSLNTLTASLLRNVTTGYKHRSVDDLGTLFSSRNFADALSAYKYLMIAQRYRQDMLLKTTQTKFEYDQEKSTKEKKQQEIESLKKNYIKQGQDLVEQQKAKQLLLVQTKNSEANYQRLLAQAQSELDSFRGFSKSKGGGLLGEVHSPDGWYYSQRDSRWGNMCIGNSCGTRNEGTILDVGCLITDVAMIKKKFGENVTPATIAATSAYFFSTTAYMLQPWPAPGGYHYDRGSYDQGKIDSALRDGRPVIAHLRINTRDGHFIVLKSGTNGDYIMHDPWEGYDKKFQDFYNTSQITSVGYLVRN